MALEVLTESQGRFSCLFLVTPLLVSSDITTMVITRGLLRNAYNGFSSVCVGGCSRALTGSLCLYRLPNRISISSQPDFFILKNEDAQNNSFLCPKEMIWNSGKSLSGDISWALNPAGRLGSEKDTGHCRESELLGVGATLATARVPVDLVLHDPESTKGYF